MTEKEYLEKEITQAFDDVIFEAVRNSDVSDFLLGIIVFSTIADATQIFKENFTSKRFKSNLSITEIETMIDDISEKTRKKYLG